MAKDQEESGQNVGDEGQPNPETSTDGDEQTSFDVEAIADALDPLIDQKVQKQWQSGKDRRIAKLEGKVDDFESKLVDYQEMVDRGVSKEDALWRMKVDAQLASQDEPEGDNSTPTEGEPGSSKQKASVDTVNLLDKLGLDENMPEVANILRDEKDSIKQVAAFADLAVKNKSSATQENPATIASSGGQVGTPDVTQLTEELEKLQNFPSQNWERISEIGAELDKIIPKE